jgi:hypothetical protein
MAYSEFEYRFQNTATPNSHGLHGSESAKDINHGLARIHTDQKVELAFLFSDPRQSVHIRGWVFQRETRNAKRGTGNGVAPPIRVNPCKSVVGFFNAKRET